jgi:tetratricopeptide (TPR) repeat protein
MVAPAKLFNQGDHVTIRLRFVMPVLLLAGVAALAADPPVSQDQAVNLLRSGKRDEARRAFEAIIAAKPHDPSEALFDLGTMDLQDGKWQEAKLLIEQLMKLRPAFYPGWELMVQAYQAAGDFDDRDAAIQSLYTAWRSALDPAIRSRISFVRDRILGPKHTLIAQETLDPGGDDILLFLFAPADEPGQQRHLIVVKSDSETNERWRENGTVSYGTVVYHLDTLEQLPNGRLLARPYQFYLEPPDYDQVRAKVVEILAGTAQPLTGSADPFWAGQPTK